MHNPGREAVRFPACAFSRLGGQLLERERVASWKSFDLLEAQGFSWDSDA
jgi:hypothetical protein